MPSLASVKIQSLRDVWRRVFPTPALAVLMGIGILDLFSTAMLHRAGLIVELNPLMKLFIERSEWLFGLVKGLTLGAAWGAMAWYAQHDLKFVARASWIGSAVYLGVWLFWFFGAS